MFTKNGGPAFPLEIKRRSMLGFEAGEEYYSGMTLRDYFAARIVPALIGSEVWMRATATAGDGNSDLQIYAEAAREAFQIADAMLHARGQGEEVKP